jgi:hypothetical protein
LITNTWNKLNIESSDRLKTVAFLFPKSKH